MPLLRRRPRIQLFTPRVVVAGRPFITRVVLHCREAVPLEFVDVELRGALDRFRERESGTEERVIEFLRQRARVREAGPLAVGEHSWSVTFRLPPGAPVSYSGGSYRISYTYHVHASVPWWPDARAAFVAHVESAPAETASPPATSVFASGPTQGESPNFELSLGTTVVGPGEPLRGAIALADARRHAYREATLALVALESADGFLGRTSHRHEVCRWTLPADRLREAEPLAFTLQLPDGVVAGFDHGGVALAWYLHARVDVAWSRDPEVWIPLTVVGRREPALQGERAPPAVGTRRVEALWRDVATRCGLASEPGAMHGVVAGAQLRISREHADGRGAVAVARLTTPDLGLGLGLAGAPAKLVGRDMSQTTCLNEHVEKLLERCPPRAADDRGLVFEVDEPGRDAAALRRFVDDVKAVAAALAAAREVMPAPAAMAAHVPAWERAAGQLGGRLQRACMAVTGVIDGLAVAVRTDWDARGRPRRTLFEVRPAVPIDRRHHLVWRAEDSAPPATELPLAPLWPGAGEIVVDAESVRVALDGPLADPLERIDQVTALTVVGKHIEGRRGHYR
ncbi:hypothetical protein [Nannocystis punicea]|uniref:Arrestin-like N-terminal domain-containing protein n=1 Tax=Nannocystis punicea TaxID=2995304 RepID=A0ABY7GXK6_9BACT|nr:hypothetical protein [Nannocystis poenicansa]WAS91710.1 hypothetical protein O0S08_36475 [Nannocystis poenicansa]